MGIASSKNNATTSTAQTPLEELYDKLNTHYNKSEKKYEDLFDTLFSLETKLAEESRRLAKSIEPLQQKLEGTNRLSSICENAQSIVKSSIKGVSDNHEADKAIQEVLSHLKALNEIDAAKSQKGGGAHDTVVVLGRKRRVFRKGRHNMVMVNGKPIKLSDAKKMAAASKQKKVIKA